MVTIRDFQDLMKELYFHRDSQRGVDRTYIWLVEEVGELGDAIITNNQTAIEDEVSDIFAWLASLCNILNFDLESVVMKKYKNSCPRCKSRPCRCPLV
ncbi:nucleotide pyrophosphohydrolase [Candidatus Bathyarchaeota archaeon]|nr:nucleotide pyrophosphohydrolase [Candidatus Bathyarchaeota archaeon]